MRYADVVEVLSQIAHAHEACSREWKISDSLIMCVEVDLSEALQAKPAQSERWRGPRLVRITFFRLPPEGGTESWLDKPPGQDERCFSPAEQPIVYEFRVAIQGWTSGALECLPPSTSRVLADRLRR